jgi:1,4-alpha-glucan branching enzyme
MAEICKFEVTFMVIFTHPGTKLLFMDVNLSKAEWNFESLDWHLLQYPLHEGVKKLITDLNDCTKLSLLLHENNLVLKVSNGLIIQIIKMQLCHLFEKRNKR